MAGCTLVVLFNSKCSITIFYSAVIFQPPSLQNFFGYAKLSILRFFLTTEHKLLFTAAVAAAAAAFSLWGSRGHFASKAVYSIVPLHSAIISLNHMPKKITPQWKSFATEQYGEWMSHKTNYFRGSCLLTMQLWHTCVFSLLSLFSLPFYMHTPECLIPYSSWKTKHAQANTGIIC